MFVANTHGTTCIGIVKVHQGAVARPHSCVVSLGMRLVTNNLFKRISMLVLKLKSCTVDFEHRESVCGLLEVAMIMIIMHTLL